MSAPGGVPVPSAANPSRFAKGFGLVTGIAALAAGAVATGIELERRVVSRRLNRSPEPEHEDFFGLRSKGPTVRTPDGVDLHVEVEPGPAQGAGVTVVLVHGYVLSQRCWYFQRKHLRERHKVVCYDQRSHGESGRSKSRHCRVPRLAKDLRQVLDATTEPDEKVVLIGHSMGGMTIQEFARQFPGLIGTKVVGVGLLATSSGGLAHHSIVPGISGERFPAVANSVLSVSNRIPAVVERSRKVSNDVSFVVTRRMSFGSPVPANYVDFMSEMVAATPMEVVADFYPAFAEFDGAKGLRQLGKVESLVIGGEADAIIPVQHTLRILEQLPGAESVVIPHSGHMGMLEHHDLYTQAIDEFIARCRLD